VWHHSAHEINVARLPRPSAKKVSAACAVHNFFHAHGFVLEVRGHKDLFFEVKTKELREEIIARINETAESAKSGESLLLLWFSSKN